MSSIEVVEIAPGEHRLCLVAGTTEVDDVIVEAGHEPSGVFWEGIVELLIMGEAPHLDGRFEFDSEAGAFLASGPDRVALDELAARLQEVSVSGDRIRHLVDVAESRGFRFDD
ncbi:Imm51 family immunity protein [Dactylosporangium sp. NPDC049742]|uniref:Imm51 family immunity protein n=1 Tax=Dactylosporangium sp. NPDC049742 TaxID=3154737 RepID=UPI00341F9B46